VQTSERAQIYTHTRTHTRTNARIPVGESKIKKANEKNTKIIDEDGLFEIIKKSGPPSGASGGSRGGGGGGGSAQKKAEPVLKKTEAASTKPVPVGSKSAEKAPKNSGKAEASLSEFNAIRKEERDRHDEVFPLSPAYSMHCASTPID